ncbi:MAG: hypothetical protein HZB62_04365 [Nitrospirae bacterium]|nr:hypothetical protein [Nitrospirota bacterium]
MSRIIIMAIALALGIASFSSAEERQTPREHCKSRTSDSAANQQQMTGHDHNMQGSNTAEFKGKEMTGHLVPMTQTVSDTMRLISLKMTGEMTSQQMKQIADALDAVSTYTLRLSDIMNNGVASETELHMLHQNIDDLLTKLKEK